MGNSKYALFHVTRLASIVRPEDNKRPLTAIEELYMTSIRESDWEFIDRLYKCLIWKNIFLSTYSTLGLRTY